MVANYVDFMPIFDFTADDWVTNEAGAISARQADNLKRIWWRWLLRWAFFTAVGIYIVITVWPGDSGDTFLFWLFSLLVAVIEYVLGGDLIRLQSDIRTQAVKRLEGDVFLMRQKMTQYPNTYRLYLGEQYFDLNAKQYDGLKPLLKNKRAVLHYTARSKIILSAGV
jgi:hypothetical protein